MEIELKKILDEQKDERKTLEMRFLDARQDLRRSELINLSCCNIIVVNTTCNTVISIKYEAFTSTGHTSSLWEMEQRQKQDRHQLLKQQVREAFHMQRHQMHARHQKVQF